MRNRVVLTKSGIFTRIEHNVCLLTYSPYSGSFFAINESDSSDIFQWLNKEKSIENIPIEYLKTLGPGWAISSDKAQYPIPHLIPFQPEVWESIFIRKPILINWLITGNCPLACKYCYAEDLMRDNEKEPDYNKIIEYAKNILSYDPLAVVLTGGEPLLSPYLKEILNYFYGKTGIILDTSGIPLNDEHIDLFLKYNVFVRISLDSERPQVNDKYRIPYKSNNKFSSNKYALKAICKCLEAGVKVGVQSVATEKSRIDFEIFGDKLYKLGVSSWRILMMVPSFMNKENFLKLMGDKKSINRFYLHLLNRIMRKHKLDWKDKMTVQVVPNNSLNSTILVSPDGIFFAESNIPHKGKIIIDKNNPKKPSLESLFQKVNMYSHTDRYLNIPREHNILA